MHKGNMNNDTLIDQVMQKQKKYRVIILFIAVIFGVPMFLLLISLLFKPSSHPRSTTQGPTPSITQLAEIPKPSGFQTTDLSFLSLDNTYLYYLARNPIQ